MGEVIEGIRTQEPTPSLLTATRRLPVEHAVWNAGVTFRDTAVAVSHRWPKCPAGDQEKTPATAGGTPEFVPFMLYLPAACDDALAVTEDGLAAEANANADATVAWNVARELWTGETANASGLNNPSLQAPFPGATDEFDPTHVLAGAELPTLALGRLLAAYEDGTQKGGAVLHVPSLLAPYLLAHGDVRQQGDVYVGPNGSTVIFGPGYPSSADAWGPKTAVNAAGAAAAADQVWAYATGPVEVSVAAAELRPKDPKQRWSDRRTNLWHLWVERQAIYRFDPSAVFATLVTVPQGTE